MGTGKFQLFGLVRFNVVTFNGFGDFIRFGFRTFLYQLADSFFVNGISGMIQQIRHDLSRCLAERVRKHTGNAGIRNGHAVLDVVFFRGFHADQFKTVSCKFPKLAGIFRRDKGTSHKVKLIKVGNPFGILFICFFAFDGFDIFRMCKADINVIFEIIKNRNPVLSCGFHTNMITIILDEPVVKPLNIRVDG